MDNQSEILIETMFRPLHSIYRSAPASLSKIIIRLSPLARMILLPFVPRVRIGNSASMFLDAGNSAGFRYLKWRADYDKTSVPALRQFANDPGQKVVFDVGAAYPRALRPHFSVPSAYRELLCRDK